MNGNGIFTDPPSSATRLNREEAIRNARLFPADRKAALRALLKRAKDPAFAEEATYSVREKVDGSDSDGGEPQYRDVQRPSVRLARPIAQALGHFSAAPVLVARGVQSETWSAWAFDAQAVNYAESAPEDLSLVIQVKRDGRTEYVPLGEQQARAARERLCSIHRRIALFQVIPEEVTQRVLDRCVQTQEEQAAERIAAGNAEAAARTLAALEQLGATREQVESFLGHSIDEYTLGDEISLRGVIRAVREGIGSAVDLLTLPDFSRASSPTARAHNANGAATSDTDSGTIDTPAPPMPRVSPGTTTTEDLDVNNDDAWKGQRAQ